jgi:hypothetical protein
MRGEDPILLVVTDVNTFELEVVQALPDTAFKAILYEVASVNPVIVIGLTVPDASKNTLPPSVEYWYFVNAGFPPDESAKYTLMESIVPFTAMTFVTIGEVPG